MTSDIVDPTNPSAIGELGLTATGRAALEGGGRNWPVGGDVEYLIAVALEGEILAHVQDASPLMLVVEGLGLHGPARSRVLG